MTFTIGGTFCGTGALDLAVEHVTGGTLRFMCEIDPFRQAVLQHYWPHAVLHPDIAALAEQARTEVGELAVDMITGGFP